VGKTRRKRGTRPQVGFRARRAVVSFGAAVGRGRVVSFSGRWCEGEEKRHTRPDRHVLAVFSVGKLGVTSSLRWGGSGFWRAGSVSRRMELFRSLTLPGFVLENPPKSSSNLSSRRRSWMRATANTRTGRPLARGVGSRRSRPPASEPSTRMGRGRNVENMPARGGGASGPELLTQPREAFSSTQVSGLVAPRPRPTFDLAQRDGRHKSVLPDASVKAGYSRGGNSRALPGRVRGIRGFQHLENAFLQPCQRRSRLPGGLVVRGRVEPERRKRSAWLFQPAAQGPAPLERPPVPFAPPSASFRSPHGERSFFLYVRRGLRASSSRGVSVDVVGSASGTGFRSWLAGGRGRWQVRAPPCSSSRSRRTRGSGAWLGDARTPFAGYRTRHHERPDQQFVAGRFNRGLGCERLCGSFFFSPPITFFERAVGDVPRAAPFVTRSKRTEAATASGGPESSGRGSNPNRLRKRQGRDRSARLNLRGRTVRVATRTGSNGVRAAGGTGSGTSGRTSPGATAR